MRTKSVSVLPSARYIFAVLDARKVSHIVYYVLIISRLQDSRVSSVHSLAQKVLFEGTVAGYVVFQRFVPVCRKGTGTEEK